MNMLLGHNGFFGIDHMSHQSGRAKDRSFAHAQDIMAIVKQARMYGAEGMMLSTHSKAQALCEIFSTQSEFQDFSLYPLLPYAQKYVTLANQKGLLGAALEMIKAQGFSGSVQLFRQAAGGLISRDLYSLLSALIQVELQCFKKCSVKTVILHDVFTDMGVAFDLPELFEFFMSEIKTQFGWTAGFATKNLPALNQFLRTKGIETKAVLTHVNALGFGMNPSRAAVEDVLKEIKTPVIAMGALASGRLSPPGAANYLAAFQSVQSVVLGVSSRHHLQPTFQAFSSLAAELRGSYVNG